MNEVTNLCSICLEQYKLPVILPCSHSFCQTCLASHIKSSCVNLDPPLGFPCPLCRVFIPAPGKIGQYSTDEWVTKFPENKLLVSIINDNLICKPCEEDGEEEKANSWCLDCSEALCERCEKYHTKPKPCRHHVIVSLTDRSGTYKKSQMLESCEIHDGRKLELFCKKHLQPCCSVCVAKEHNNCNSLCQIEDVDENIFGPEIVECLQREVGTFCSTMKQTIQEEKANMDAIDDTLNKLSKELSEFTQTIIHGIKCLEEKHLDEIAKLSKTSKSKLQTSVESFEQRLLYLLYWKEILIESKETSQTNTVLSYSKLKTILEGLQTLNYSKMRISVQSKFSDYAQKQKMQNFLVKITSNEYLNDVKFNLYDIRITTAEVKTLKELKIRPSIVYGGDVLNEGKLLLADNNLDKLILCDIDGVLQEKKLQGPPYGVCVCGENEVLVTLPTKQKVLRIDSVSLDIKDTMSVPCNCYGITTSGNRSAIGARDLVLIFNDGLDDRKCIKLRTGLSHTDDVVLDIEGNVISSCYAEHKVTCRKGDQVGKVLFTYTHKKLKSPCGLSVNRNGNIFVNGYNSNNIHILSKEGRLLWILEEIKRPTWVKFHDDTSRLFVMESGSNLRVLKFNFF
ncbi:uncharacterized protein LOC111130422 [Crassostrea virginica]